MNTKILAVINLITTIVVIVWNGYTGANGWNGNTVGGMSDLYDSLFTPAGYTFSIWSIIFLGLMLVAIQFMRIAYSQKDKAEIVHKIAPTLIAANMFNTAWVFFWLEEYPGISVLLMLGILTSLLITNLKNDTLTPESAAHPWLVKWPIQTYAGWIIVATVANVSVYLNYIEFDMLFSQEIWACIMIVIATGIIAYVYVAKNWIFCLFVGLWALLGIVAKQNGLIPSISYTAIACMVVLAIVLISKLATGKK